ncbi:MAG: murein L,D-transpeptidase catalytic domain family protein [Gammaproteobacteria bacterium]|nr:murein L,D-transpeptidase catalytic domain family protein [Gammaproteobacteria bacterium]
MRARFLLYVLALLSIVGWGQFHFAPISPVTTGNISIDDDSVGSQSWMDKETKSITAQANNINPNVLKLSLTAYSKARHKNLDDKGLLTIVDYSKPSSERRLWVVDVKKQKVLFNTWVAHGKNSGALNSTSFSNDPRSLKSSLGVFLTSDTYSGKNGYSLHIQGLESGINDHAYNRAIVFHGASYVSGGRSMMGRSWGCLAVSRDVVKPLINTIKSNTLVVAYYPDKNWLKHSSYVNTDIA